MDRTEFSKIRRVRAKVVAKKLTHVQRNIVNLAAVTQTYTERQRFLSQSTDGSLHCLRDRLDRRPCFGVFLQITHFFFRPRPSGRWFWFCFFGHALILPMRRGTREGLSSGLLLQKSAASRSMR